jgi:hypothetical protein
MAFTGIDYNQNRALIEARKKSKQDWEAWLKRNGIELPKTD